MHIASVKLVCAFVLFFDYTSRNRCFLLAMYCLYLRAQGAIGSGVNVKEFEPKAPFSNPDEAAR